MRAAQDPRGVVVPLFHLVSEQEPSPGGELVLTLCGQRIVSQKLIDRDLPELLNSLCFACRAKLIPVASK